MSPEFQKIQSLENIPLSDLEQLNEQLREMDLNGLREMPPWARFETTKVGRTLTMEVGREDGTTTLCYLTSSLDPKSGGLTSNVYLQVTSGLLPERNRKRDSAKDLRSAEVDGIFPTNISFVRVGYSSIDGSFIGFYGKDDRTGIIITNEGKIRFSWA